MTTACDAIELLLAARFDGTLAADDAAQLARHLAGCVACRGLADTLAPVTDPRGDHAALPAVPTSAYAVGDEVARGGMGRIVAARDLRIGRPVAFKELLAGAVAKARFEREARVTARLQHPGIVPIYEIGAWPDGTPFYVMRMVEGRTLHQAIAAIDGAAERMRLLPAVITACETIAFAHSKRIIHRDLTPSNILVGAYGETVVIDWGLAKDLAAPEGDDGGPDAGPYRVEPARADVTRAGAVLGTAAYMPPEQARGADVDERADVYALGALLYQLLSGAPPYQGSSEAVLEQVRTAPPPPLAKRAMHAPRDLVSIVDKAMARDAADRYAHAGELAEELQRFQAGRFVVAHRYSPRERVRHWIRRHRIATAALTAVAIAGGLGAAMVVRERGRVDTRGREADGQAAEVAGRIGKTYLAHGNRWSAAVALAEAARLGTYGPIVRFLLARAMTGVDAIELTVKPDGRVYGLEFSPDGGRLLIKRATRIDQIRIPDGAPLASIAIPRRPSDSIHLVQYTDDGQQILANRFGEDGVGIEFWDANSGAFLRFEEREFVMTNNDRDAACPVAPEVEGCVTSLDGTRRADWNDSTLTVWDVAGKRRLSSFLVPWGEPRHVFFAAAGSRVVTVDGNDYAVLISDTTTGEPIELIDDLNSRAFAVSPDRSRIAVATLTDEVSVINLDADRGVRSFDAAARGASKILDVESDGKVVLATDAQEHLLLWRGDTEVPLAVAGLPADLSDDGSRLAAWSGGAIQIIDADTGRSIRTLADDADMAPRSVALSGDGSRVLIVTRDGRALIRDVESNAVLDLGSEIDTAILNDAGDRVAACRADRPVLFAFDGALLGLEEFPKRGSDEDEPPEIVFEGDDNSADADEKEVEVDEPRGPCALLGFHVDQRWAAVHSDYVTWLLGSEDVSSAVFDLGGAFAFDATGSKLATAGSARIHVERAGIWDSPTFTIDATQPIAALALNHYGTLVATDTGVWHWRGFELLRWARTSSGTPRVEFAHDGRSVIVVDGLVVTIRDTYLEERSAAELARLIEARTGLRPER